MLSAFDGAWPTGVHDSREAYAARCLTLCRELDPGRLDDVRAAFALSESAVESLRERGGRLEPVARESIAPAVLVPGLLGDSVRRLVAPMMVARDALQPIGFDIDVIWVNGRSGSARNAARLSSRVQEAAARAGRPVHLIGYSKGCTDALHLLADHPDSHAALASLTSLAGVVHGTPLAAATPTTLHRLLARLPLPGLGRGDGRAIVDLTPAARHEHLAAHPLPSDLRYASLVAAPGPERVSRVLRHSWRTLARIDPANDSQVIAADAVLPRGELLGVLDADHWAMALPITSQQGDVRAGPLGPAIDALARWFVSENALPRTLLLAALLEHLSVPLPKGS